MTSITVTTPIWLSDRETLLIGQMLTVDDKVATAWISLGQAKPVEPEAAALVPALEHATKKRSRKRSR
jgi:hypothetical protein